MRDAENGRKVMKLIKDETGIGIEIIPGAEEAQLLCNNLVENTEGGVGNFAYVHVGGGSTDISLIHDGIVAESHSFNIGIAHGGCGAGAEELHVVDQHELLEAFHHVEHGFRPLFGNLAEGEHVVAQTQRNTDEHQFADAPEFGCFVIEALDEQTGAVGPDVYGGYVDGFHCSVLFSD